MCHAVFLLLLQISSAAVIPPQDVKIYLEMWMDLREIFDHYNNTFTVSVFMVLIVYLQLSIGTYLTFVYFLQRLYWASAAHVILLSSSFVEIFLIMNVAHRATSQVIVIATFTNCVTGAGSGERRNECSVFYLQMSRAFVAVLGRGSQRHLSCASYEDVRNKLFN